MKVMHPQRKKASLNKWDGGRVSGSNDYIDYLHASHFVIEAG